ncbi:MAG: hypothetical protein NVS9B7_29480 [Flavisolibacter sp.]
MYEKETELTNVIETLRELNVLCVTLQYKNHYIGTLDNEMEEQLTIVKDRTEKKTLSLHGLYNALKCVNYQIEIEHLKEIRELSTREENAILFLDIMMRAISEQIVENLPEDKTHVWEVN